MFVVEIDFDFDNQLLVFGVLCKCCQVLIESVEESFGGLVVGLVQLCVECGLVFFVDLVVYKEIWEIYFNIVVVNELWGRVVDEFIFGGIIFCCYGGMIIGVLMDKVFFYLQGIEGFFEIYFVLVDIFEMVNMIGLLFYVCMILDWEWDEWVWFEIESNLLLICIWLQVLCLVKWI